MKFFKDPLNANDVFKDIVVKTAVLDLTNDRPDQWREEIREYISNKYPFLTAGLKEVKYNKIDESTGDAIGSIVWMEGNTSMTIPVIIENNILKDIDAAIYQNKVIPISESFILSEVEKNQEMGQTEETNDVSDEIEFLTEGGLFDVSDQTGIKVAATISTVARVRNLLDSRGVKLPENIENLIKEGVAKGKNDEDRILVIKRREIPEKPYHFSGIMLKQASDGKYKIERFEMSAEDFNKIAGFVEGGCVYDSNSDSDCLDNRTTKYVSMILDKQLKDMPKIKKITESGNYQYILFNGIGKRGVVVTDPLKIWETGKSRALAVSENTSALHETNDPREWIYGEVYGGSDDYENLKTKSQGYYFGGMTPVDLQNVQGKDIIFEASRTITLPYRVEEVTKTRLAKDGREIVLYYLKSYHDGSHATVWLNSGIDKVTKADTEKMIAQGLGAIVRPGRDIYLLPEYYRPIFLPGKRIKDSKIKSQVSDIMKNIQTDYPIKTAIEMVDMDEYRVTVRNGSRKIFDETMKKEASLLVANYFTGQNADRIEDYDPSDIYLSKYAGNIKDIEPKHYVDLSAMDKYRGDFIKTASILWREWPIEKDAEIENVINGLISAEYADKKNIVNSEELLELLSKTLNKIGNVLLLSRMSKTHLSEPILTKAFKAITGLISDIKGE